MKIHDPRKKRFDRHFVRVHPCPSVVKNQSMKDGPIRRTIKRIARFRYRVDLWVARAVRRRTHPPRYRLAGECNGCGACCETPMIQTNAIFFRLRTTRWLILTWHRLVNGFEFIRDGLFRAHQSKPQIETRLAGRIRFKPYAAIASYG